MRTTNGKVPAYNVQTAVDAEHALIVTQQVSDEATDNRSLQPMAEAAQAAVGGSGTPLHVVADAGYSSGEQAQACENHGIIPHVPAVRGVNNRGDGTLFERSDFQYDETSDTFLCPAGERLYRHQRKDRYIVYAGQPRVCGACALRSRCTVGSRRLFEKASARSSVGTYAATGNTRSNASAKTPGRTSVRGSEVPHLRAPALFVAWTARRTNGDQFRSDCL